jgi:hypothetical protein
MNTQSEALQIADELLEGKSTYFERKAAAELRRLHEVNTGLLEELQKALPCLREFGFGNQFKNAKAAIAKATRE